MQPRPAPFYALAPLAVLTAVVTAAAPASAADVTVEVRDSAGRPAPNAVVMVRPSAGVKPGAPMKLTAPLVMSQKDIQFSPYVLIAPLGSTVAFPNRDKVRHHVYSFSPAKRFELKLYGRDESRTVTFDKPGPVSLGCNIHDTMIAFIYVTDTPYAAKTGADGLAVIEDVPPGEATLVVWSPDLKARTPPVRPLTVTAAPQRVGVAIELRPGPAKP